MALLAFAMRTLGSLRLWVYFLLVFYILLIPHRSSVPVRKVVWTQKDPKGVGSGSGAKARRVGNVPDSVWNNWNASLSKSLDHSCVKFPTIDDIYFNNAVWQMQALKNDVTAYLFNAYLDTRSLNEFAPEVRITLMADNVGWLQEACEASFCHFWYRNETTPLTVKVRKCRPLWDDRWKGTSRYVGQLMACPLPEGRKEKVPDSVSLLPEECGNATNNLHVHYDTPEEGEGGKRRIGVCVKGLSYLELEDGEEKEKALRLVEWIELLGLLGADTIFMYEFAISKDVKRVLTYYEGKGVVQLSPLSFPGTLPNEPELRHRYLKSVPRATEKRKNELIPYNDCLYRNLYRYEYLTLLDTDEVILPTAFRTWRELLELSPRATYDARTYPVSSFVFQQSHFFNDLENEEVPEKYYMLKHVFRDFSYTIPWYSGAKCIHRTDRVEALHNHFVLSCLGSCNGYHFPEEDGVMQHYRTTTKFSDYMNGSKGETKTCLDGREFEYCLDHYAKEDTRIFGFKDQLISRVENALKEIGPLKEVINN